MQWCSSSRKIRCDWLYAQDQNKRLRNRYCDFELRTVGAATIPNNNHCCLALSFGFRYQASYFVSYKDCYISQLAEYSEIAPDVNEKDDNNIIVSR